MRTRVHLPFDFIVDYADLTIQTVVVHPGPITGRDTIHVGSRSKLIGDTRERLAQWVERVRTTTDYWVKEINK